MKTGTKIGGGILVAGIAYVVWQMSKGTTTATTVAETPQVSPTSQYLAARAAQALVGRGVETSPTEISFDVELENIYAKLGFRNPEFGTENWKKFVRALRADPLMSTVYRQYLSPEVFSGGSPGSVWSTV